MFENFHRTKGIRKHSAILLLAVGLLIRLPMLGEPLVEGYRTAQTATLTAGMIEDDRLRMDPIAPWRGDLDARVVLELPIYNLAVLAVHTLPGISLDIAGRAVSLIFWILSFIALQSLWRRTLPPSSRIWANLLFVLAPMNWYLSTTFMPETLIQWLAIVFLVVAIDYGRSGNGPLLVGLIFVAAMGLLVKLPAFAHLGVFLALVMVDRRGVRSLFHPGLLVGGAFLILAIVGWGKYVESVNTAYFSYWCGWEGLKGFLWPSFSRFSASYYIPLIGYNLAFVLPLVAAPFALVGLVVNSLCLRSSYRSRIWTYLFGSLILYWLVWGKAAPAQNYYNLPNLVLFSALFGMGVTRISFWLRRRSRAAWIVPLGQAALILALAASGVAGVRYLSRPDEVTMEVAGWVKANARPNDLILYQPRHAATVMDYEHQPLLSHLTGRRTWIWTRYTPDAEKDRALQTAAFAVVTNPPQKTGALENLRRKFKGQPNPPPQPFTETHAGQFIEYFKTETFTVYRRSHRQDAENHTGSGTPDGRLPDLDQRFSQSHRRPRMAAAD